MVLKLFRVHNMNRLIDGSVEKIQINILENLFFYVWSKFHFYLQA
jgi:hypothetical protein